MSTPTRAGEVEVLANLRQRVDRTLDQHTRQPHTTAPGMGPTHDLAQLGDLQALAQDHQLGVALVVRVRARC